MHQFKDEEVIFTFSGEHQCIERDLSNDERLKSLPEHTGRSTIIPQLGVDRSDRTGQTRSLQQCSTLRSFLSIRRNISRI